MGIGNYLKSRVLNYNEDMQKDTDEDVDDTEPPKIKPQLIDRALTIPYEEVKAELDSLSDLDQAVWEGIALKQGTGLGTNLREVYPPWTEAKLELMARRTLWHIDRAASFGKQLYGIPAPQPKNSSSVEARHRIGEHELCEPDYQLVCAWAEELGWELEAVLEELFNSGEDIEERSVLKDGRFEVLEIMVRRFPVKGIPAISGLTVKELIITGGVHLEIDLDLLNVPNLTKLVLYSIRLANLDQPDLSLVPNLAELSFIDCGLAELDLRHVPKLTFLECSENNIMWLDLSPVPNLTYLSCSNYLLSKLDIKPVRNLETLMYYSDITRLIKRPDQDF